MPTDIGLRLRDLQRIELLSFMDWQPPAWTALSSPKARRVATATARAKRITEAFPWNEGRRYLICDPDQVYGTAA
jgi:hypothetical protein